MWQAATIGHALLELAVYVVQALLDCRPLFALPGLERAVEIGVCAALDSVPAGIQLFIGADGHRPWP